jgi:hypothetical protein
MPLAAPVTMTTFPLTERLSDVRRGIRRQAVPLTERSNPHQFRTLLHSFIFRLQTLLVSAPGLGVRARLDAENVSNVTPVAHVIEELASAAIARTTSFISGERAARSA